MFPPDHTHPSPACILLLGHSHDFRQTFIVGLMGYLAISANTASTFFFNLHALMCSCNNIGVSFLKCFYF